MRFKYTVAHVPGKELVVVDALSRAPSSHHVHNEDMEFGAEIQAYVDMIVGNIPMSEPKMRGQSKKMRNVKR